MPIKQFYSNTGQVDARLDAETLVNPFRCQGFVRDGTLACRNGARRSIESLPAFLRALLVTDGTVTKILEAYFWEPVLVDTLYQEFTVAEAEIPWIEIQPGDRALVRRVRLRGGDTGHEYAHADSVVRVERVPENFRHRLINREIGIGALIRDSGLESYREVMEVGVNPACRGAHGQDDPLAADEAPPINQVINQDDNQDATRQIDSESLFRTYRIIIAGEPVILITETFPLALFRSPTPGEFQTRT